MTDQRPMTGAERQRKYRERLYAEGYRFVRGRPVHGVPAAGKSRRDHEETP